MSILEIEESLFQIEKAYCDDSFLHISLKGGLGLSTPVSWYERLLNATHEQRNNIRILPFGDALHWPDLDEDLSVQGILRYAGTHHKTNAFEVAE